MDSNLCSPSKVAVTLAEMIRVWRSIASHRLMDSMAPLPHTDNENYFCNSRRGNNKMNQNNNFRGTMLVSAPLAPPLSLPSSNDLSVSVSVLSCSSSAVDVFRSPDSFESGVPQSSIIRAIPSATVPTATAIATSTYRELRKLRSMVRVPVNGSKGIGTGGGTQLTASQSLPGDPTRSQDISFKSSIYLGRESRQDRADLIEKFTQSLLYCGESIML